MGFGIDTPDSEQEDTAVAALLLLHRRRQKATNKTKGSEYQRVVSHFERRGERMRGERLVTEELVQRLLGASALLGPRPVQRELEVLGPAGGIAAGRLRVRNPSPLCRVFELSIGDSVSGTFVPEVRVDPQQGTLAEGESAWLRIEVSLDGIAPGASATLPIECRWETGIDRIWLVVTADLSEGVRR